MNPTLYDDEAERRQHQDSIQTLAHELKIDENKVTDVYESLLMSYKNRVTIIHYLPIFITRKVKQVLLAGLIAQSKIFSEWPLSGSI